MREKMLLNELCNMQKTTNGVRQKLSQVEANYKLLSSFIDEILLKHDLTKEDGDLIGELNKALEMDLSKKDEEKLIFFLEKGRVEALAQLAVLNSLKRGGVEKGTNTSSTAYADLPVGNIDVLEAALYHV